MGNCFGTTSSSSVKHWAGEDWSSLNNNSKKKQSSTEDFDELKLMNNKDDKLLAVADSSAPSSSSSSNGKIKIRISKKDLQVLLEELEKQKKKKNSAEQVLVRLMEVRDLQHHRAGQNWSPVLETIREVN